jgi:hypothetical protein
VLSRRHYACVALSVHVFFWCVGGHRRWCPRVFGRRGGSLTVTERIVSIPVNALRAWGSDPEPAVREPVGVSHVAVVTADLDGFRAFYEETIGLESARLHTNAHPQRSEP